jgi:ParG
MKKSGIPLGKIIGRNAQPIVLQTEPVVQQPEPVTPRAPTSTRPPRTRKVTPTREVPKPTRDTVKQLNVEIPLELHKRVKVKAMLEGRSMADVVEELLEGWAGEM